MTSANLSEEVHPPFANQVQNVGVFLVRRRHVFPYVVVKENESFAARCRPYPCRVKEKELRNTCHKARKANHHSGAVATSYGFYKELDAIFSGDPTSTVKATVDTLVARVPVKSGPSQEEEILDEDVEGEEDPEAEDNSEVRDACSQELLSTPDASHSCRSLAKCKQERMPLGRGFDFGNR
ncbi:hypothetical protein UY3_16376 [Chelonia mydas]|uniref:Uncharacterized protein n=1 Tax=Chelonia mydas TaxID=8469 RepID=M7BE95_CHEMY|nr:hypothetical protein UY3_16376 [Chelonia mydas]